jgi:hypothetical protein
VTPNPHSKFYARWIAANGWAEAAGLGTTLILGRAVAPALEREGGLAAILLAAVAAVILGILLEGVLVGSAQAWVLRAALRNLSAASWVRATMIGAALAWLLGMVPSTVAALMVSPPSSGAAHGSNPSAAVQYGLAVLLGAVTGPVLGLAQWLELRRHTARANRWILANAVAWALGMVVIFVGMDQVPWGRGGLAVVLGVYLVCGAAGLMVGATHGWVLRDLVREANSAPAAA